MNIEMSAADFRREYMNGGDPVKQPNRKVTKSDRTKLEDAFVSAWLAIGHGLPLPSQQHRFCKRRWRFDFAWLDAKLAIELQGGGFVHGGHNRGAQQAKDHEKLNEAQRMGWIVLQYGSKAMSDPYKVAAEVAKVLTQRLAK